MSADRVMGSDASRAVGRFSPDGPAGYVAATMPNAPLRATRAEAVDDELSWLESRTLHPHAPLMGALHAYLRRTG